MAQHEAGPQATSREEREKATGATSTVISSQGDSVNEKILGELRQLISIQAAHLTDESASKVQALWTFILQLLGVAVGVLFGVFAALAWKQATDAKALADAANDIASQANELSEVANFMAIAAYCQSQNTGNAVCSAVQSAASTKVSVYASSFYGINPSTTITTRTTTTGPTPTSSSTPGGHHSAGAGPNTNDLVGIVVGSLLGLAATLTIAYIQYYIYKQKTKSRNAIRLLAKLPETSNRLFFDE